MTVFPASSGVHGCLTFEVTPVSLQHLTISFEHPVKDSIALGKAFVYVSALAWEEMLAKVTDM